MPDIAGETLYGRTANMPLTGSVPVPSEAEAEAGKNADKVFQMLTGHWVSQTVRTVAELHVVDHVAAGADTADEVARLERCDIGTTYRLMRASASLGLLSWRGNGRFGMTPMGTLLREGVPGSLRDAALTQNQHAHWQAWELLPEGVRHGRTQVDSALGSDLFQYFSAHPAEGETFSRAMADMTGLVIEDTVRLLDLGDAQTVVDVGGANGDLLLGLMRANPGIRGVVLELPFVVDGARKAGAGLGDRFSAVAGDFFAEVPSGDYFLLKWILHDWSDQDCVRILRKIRAASRPGARTLVVEAVVGDVGEPDTAVLLDMNMLVVSEGQERDLQQFDMLFAASGWRRVGLMSTRSLYSLLEIEAI